MWVFTRLAFIDIGEDVACFKKKIKELCAKAAQAEEEIRERIEKAGSKALSGQYTEELIPGAKP